ncbi:hypothetical protein [Streptomyces sp. NPDC054874]
MAGRVRTVAPFSWQPVSAQVTAVLGAVGSGVASEAGKWAWETAGGLVRRMAGREFAAPTRPEERDAVARIIHDSVRSDPELARTWSAFARTVQTTGATIGRPRLPASVRFFTDRKGAMRLLDREAGRKADGRPRVAVLYGDDSMGTSALAVHWGWRAESLFPDGQLYVDLGRRGAGSAHTAGSALRELLLRLGLRDERIPPSETERIDAFHRVVADRKLLLVLDHARSGAQIAPLLTSAPSVSHPGRGPATALRSRRVPGARGTPRRPGRGVPAHQDRGQTGHAFRPCGAPRRAGTLRRVAVRPARRRTPAARSRPAHCGPAAPTAP